MKIHEKTINAFYFSLLLFFRRVQWVSEAQDGKATAVTRCNIIYQLTTHQSTQRKPIPLITATFSFLNKLVISNRTIWKNQIKKPPIPSFGRSLRSRPKSNQLVSQVFEISCWQILQKLKWIHKLVYKISFSVWLEKCALSAIHEWHVSLKVASLPGLFKSKRKAWTAT